MGGRSGSRALETCSQEGESRSRRVSGGAGAEKMNGVSEFPEVRSRKVERCVSTASPSRCHSPGRVCPGSQFKNNCLAKK